MTKLKLKNNQKKNIKITTFDNIEYTLKPNEEIILGNYTEENLQSSIKYLYKDLELSKIEEENINDGVIRLST